MSRRARHIDDVGREVVLPGAPATREGLAVLHAAVGDRGPHALPVVTEESNL